MPILGVIASSTRQGQSTDAGAMFPISSVIVGSAGSSTINFSSIPQTYTHLQLRLSQRCSVAGAGLNGSYIEFNSDTTAGNYSFHRLVGDGSSASSYGVNSLDGLAFSTTNGDTGNYFAYTIIDIFDYTSTNKYKTCRSLNGGALDSQYGAVGLYGQAWKNTNAITSIQIVPAGGTLVQSTTAYLYGVK